MRLGLDRIGVLLAELGEPQKRFDCVLVAGTNGKGTTAANLAAILSSAESKVGLYTSPHLERVEERIRIDGLEIKSEDLATYLERILRVAEEAGLTAPTYFEAMTAVAFEYFSSEEVDVAVLEVGLGGRLDATNTVDPVLAVITEIGLDHQNVLGSTISEIAAEKAGILRRGVPLCHGVSDPDAAQVIEERARNLGSEVFALDSSRRTLGERLFAEGGADLGVHQRRNLQLAELAAKVFTSRATAERTAKPALSDAAVERALASCRWPGRSEWVQRPDGGLLLLDGAHNPQGVRALSALIGDRNYGLVFGALRDKDAEVSLDLLRERAAWTILTRPPDSRSLDPEGLAGPNDVVAKDPPQALEQALARAEADEILVISGSLYLVGELRAELRRRWGRPPSSRRIYGPF